MGFQLVFIAILLVNNGFLWQVILKHLGRVSFTGAFGFTVFSNLTRAICDFL